MNFRGKINSLDIGDKIVDMSVTVGNKNFDVSFEVLWDSSSDEFEGWAELAEIVDQNRVDRQGAVMADIKAGRRELTVKYDGGEAYAYGDEAQVDVETENIPGGNRKDPKYINEEGQFDFKKFVAEGRLLKENYSERKHHPGEAFIHKYLTDSNINPTNPMYDQLYIDDIRGYEGYVEDQSAVFSLMKDVERAGGKLDLFLEPYDLELTIVGDNEALGIRINEGKGGLEEQGPKPKRKHRKNPTRFGRGSHGKIPNFDDAIDAAEPSYPYGVDDPETTSNNASKARSAAKKMGLEPELEKAEYEMHFGRGGGGRRSGEQDPFKYKNPNKRVTKGGKLHKQDLKVAKQDSKRSLDVMRQNKAFKKQQGDFLPEFTLKEIDEMLKEARSKDNK